MTDIRVLTDKSPMPFGKFRNRPMEQVPADYLLWLHEQPHLKDESVRLYIWNNMNVLKEQAKFL